MQSWAVGGHHLLYVSWPVWGLLGANLTNLEKSQCRLLGAFWTGLQTCLSWPWGRCWYLLLWGLWDFAVHSLPWCGASAGEQGPHLLSCFLLFPGFLLKVSGLCRLLALSYRHLHYDQYHSPQNAATYLLLCFSVDVRQVLGVHLAVWPAVWFSIVKDYTLF